jgi:AbiV family abortive infection protein
MSTEKKSAPVRPYSGELTPVQAASAIRAARLNALDLADTAAILFQLMRFAHSVALSILSIEESAKRELIMNIFLGFERDSARLWKAYRQHRAKTSKLNYTIEGRVRANFPDVDPADARSIGELGPTPDELEMAKQQALYSDCLQGPSGVVIHGPGDHDWRHYAWGRFCEAKTLAESLRDYPPADGNRRMRGSAAEAQSVGQHGR